MRGPTVILFDIDGTLIRPCGAGRRAMEGAIADHYGDGSTCRALGFAGMTDRAIIRAALELARHEASDDAIDRVLASYLARLPHAVAQADGYGVLPGVHALLARLAGCAEAAVGLGTGNVQAGARIKLDAVGLEFPFGGFGSDAEDRAELIRIGAERGAARLGRARADCRVVVIGDTPRDVAAAHAIDAECVAVATGPPTAEALRQSGAEVVVDDLTDPAVLEVLCTPPS